MDIPCSPYLLAAGQVTPEMVGVAAPFACQGWPDDLARIIYVDRYDNQMTGIRAGSLAAEALIAINGQRLRNVRTCSAAPVGQAFWYENSSGLVELAVNQGRAALKLGVGVSDAVTPSAHKPPN